MNCKIVTRARCGFANSGELNFVHNSHNTQGYVATILETNSSVYGTNTNTFTRQVAAGNYIELGCSKSSSASARRSWKVLGEQPYTIEDEI